jgi:hypothetical protein
MGSKVTLSSPPVPWRTVISRLPTP